MTPVEFNNLFNAFSGLTPDPKPGAVELALLLSNIRLTPLGNNSAFAGASDAALIGELGSINDPEGENGITVVVDTDRIEVYCNGCKDHHAFSVCDLYAQPLKKG